jgi:hypothetical protein
LASVIDSVGAVMRASMENRLTPLAEFVQRFCQYRDQIEPWLAVELEPKLGPWMDELEGALTAGDNAVILNRILPPFYDAMRLPDAEARKAKLRQRGLALLMKKQAVQPGARRAGDVAGAAAGDRGDLPPGARRVRQGSGVVQTVGQPERGAHLSARDSGL